MDCIAVSGGFIMPVLDMDCVALSYRDQPSARNCTPDDIIRGNSSYRIPRKTNIV